MRLIRWMITGALTAAPPIAMDAGMRKNANMPRRLGCGSRFRPSNSRVPSRERLAVAADLGRPDGVAVVQELGQHRVQVLAGANQGVVDAQPGAAAADLDQVLLQRLDVAVAQGPRVAHQVRQLLHALEARGAGEGE